MRTAVIPRIHLLRQLRNACPRLHVGIQLLAVAGLTTDDMTDLYIDCGQVARSHRGWDRFGPSHVTTVYYEGLHQYLATRLMAALPGPEWEQVQQRERGCWIGRWHSQPTSRLQLETCA